MTPRVLFAATAAVLLLDILYPSSASARAFPVPETSIPRVARQSAPVTYPQCDAAGRTHVASIMSACGGCLNGGCPDSCCTEQPTSNQWVICQVPQPGSAGCCIRVMGNGQVEVAASEVVTTKGKNAAGNCEPADAGTPSKCPAQTCALAGAGGGEEKDCPSGVLVTPPNQVYASPAQCASASASSAAATATTTTAPVSTAAAASASDPVSAAPDTVTTAAAGAAVTSGAGSTVAGVVPSGCTKTFPGYRCMGEEGYPEVTYRGGCCVGECKKDPAKGWGYWCPALSATAGDTGAGSSVTTAVTTTAVDTTTEAVDTTTEAVAETSSVPTTTVVPPPTVAVATSPSSTSVSATPAGDDDDDDAGGIIVVTEAATTTEESTDSTTDVVTVAVVTTAAPTVAAVTTRASGSDGSSTNATKVGSSDDDGSACFHGSGIVELENGSSKKLSELSVGESVKVGAGLYSRVFMFSHRNSAEPSKFVKLALSSGHEIIVTPGHYMWSDQGLVVSESVKRGDMLLLGDGGAAPVTEVMWIEDKGVYNPQTLHGDIVVNDIKASTFTRALSPKLARTMLAPLQAAYLAFGFSTKALESGAVASAVVNILPKGPSFLPF